MGVGKRFQYRIKVLSARRNPALFDMQSCIDLTGEPQDLSGPSIENSVLDFNFGNCHIQGMFSFLQIFA